MLTPEVAALLRTGKLSEFDACWISRLKPESQLPAALKCGRPNPTFGESYAKSCITHGHPSTQAR